MTVDLINSGNKQPRRTCPASAGGCGIVAQNNIKETRRSKNGLETYIIVPAQRLAEV
jgi:hypothetical protein